MDVVEYKILVEFIVEGERRFQTDVENELWATAAVEEEFVSFWKSSCEPIRFSRIVASPELLRHVESLTGQAEEPD